MSSPVHIFVIQYPGSNCDQDAVNAFNAMEGVSARLHWHKDTDLSGADALVLPGGFSFGDYLRCGAIARFSPVTPAVVRFAESGGCVLGICNGFQILCEAGLLPGALVRNTCLEFRCQMVDLKVEDAGEPFTPRSLGERLRLPIAHGEGNYRADAGTLARLNDEGRVVLRYSAPAGNPNGSCEDIAGIRNAGGNVIGMMPHPERAVRTFHPSLDGRGVLEAFIGRVRDAGAVSA